MSPAAKRHVARDAETSLRRRSLGGTSGTSRLFRSSGGAARRYTGSRQAAPDRNRGGPPVLDGVARDVAQLARAALGPRRALVRGDVGRAPARDVRVRCLVRGGAARGGGAGVDSGGGVGEGRRRRRFSGTGGGPARACEAVVGGPGTRAAVAEPAAGGRAGNGAGARGSMDSRASAPLQTGGCPRLSVRASLGLRRCGALATRPPATSQARRSRSIFEPCGAISGCSSCCADVESRS